MPLKPEVPVVRAKPDPMPSWAWFLIAIVIGAAIGLAIVQVLKLGRRERQAEVGALGVVPYYGDGIVTVMIHQGLPVCMPEGDLIEPAYEDCFLACGSIFRVEQVEEGRAIIRLTGQRTNCYDRALPEGVCPGEARISVPISRVALWTWLYVKNKPDIEAELKLP